MVANRTIFDKICPISQGLICYIKKNRRIWLQKLLLHLKQGSAARECITKTQFYAKFY